MALLVTHSEAVVTRCSHGMTDRAPKRIHHQLVTKYIEATFCGMGTPRGECLKAGIVLRKLVMYVPYYVLSQNFALGGCSY